MPSVALRGREEHSRFIVFTAGRRSAYRHAPALAAIVLALSMVGTGAALLSARYVPSTPHVDPNDLVYVACQILPYGVVGAVLIARRPDLPFGWLLSLSAMSLVVMLAISVPSVFAVQHGLGGSLAVWGLTAGSLTFLPVAVEGIINVRFPSGAPAGRLGRVLERAIVGGIVVGLLGGIIGDSTVRAIYPPGAASGADRFVDDTPVARIGDATQIVVPLVILLGILAGLGVVVRYARAVGVEQLQLRWRAVGVVVSLALFPLVVSESLPATVADVITDLEPLLFVATLAVPVLRYDLWAIDSIIRRSAVSTFASPSTALESTVRATAQLLRLPYVGVRSGGRVLASYGIPSDAVESWPLVVDGQTVGELDAAPRHGLNAIDATDRQVLGTVGQLVGGSVRAQALTADLLQARHRLVSAREEERRRLRRDLHDGLGPLLTGLGLNLDAAASQLGRSEEKISSYLASAKVASSEVIMSLRGLVDGLRPPALDELGLAGALRLRLEPLAADAALALDARVPEGLTLPAAVEVAAFRAVIEAVTNVARHGHARRVWVTIEHRGDSLVVKVDDDGQSLGAWAPGVGLAGMRERAEELGGRLTAGPTAAGGRVRVSYPLGAGR